MKKWNEIKFFILFLCVSFFCYNWQINVLQGPIFANFTKIWKNLRQLIHTKINSNKIQQLTYKFIIELMHI